MSTIGICAIAYNREGEEFDSYHTPPEVKGFIEPASPGEYADGGKYYKVDTSRFPKVGKIVIAAESVKVPLGEERQFSFWLYKSDPHSDVNYVFRREFEVHQGESGIIGLYFGVKRRPIYWPGFDLKNFNLYINLIMKHTPSNEPPSPPPW